MKSDMIFKIDREGLYDYIDRTDLSGRDKSVVSDYIKSRDTYDVIGERFSISRERVRQILIRFATRAHGLYILEHDPLENYGSIELLPDGNSNVYDTKGVQIGRIINDDNRHYGYDMSGKLLACFDPKSGITLDPNGNKLAKGNGLMGMYFPELA